MKNCNSIVKTVDAFIMHLNVQKIYQILLINIIIIFMKNANFYLSCIKIFNLINFFKFSFFIFFNLFSETMTNNQKYISFLDSCTDFS